MSDLELLETIAKEAFESGIHYQRNAFEKYVDGYLTRHDLPMDSGKICSDVRSHMYGLILDKLKSVASAYIKKYKCVPDGSASETHKHYVKFMKDNIPDKLYHDHTIMYAVADQIHNLGSTRVINTVIFVKSADYREAITVIRRESRLAGITNKDHDDYDDYDDYDKKRIVREERMKREEHKELEKLRALEERGDFKEIKAREECKKCREREEREEREELRVLRELNELRKREAYMGCGRYRSHMNTSCGPGIMHHVRDDWKEHDNYLFRQAHENEVRAHMEHTFRYG
jgi:hypothetical protein